MDPGAAAPPPPTAELTVCPRCRTAVDPGTKFCPNCGANLAAPPAPPTSGAPPVDLRNRVDQDRGTLKRLQLLVPGYSGYRQGEDLRAADSLLRLQVADRIARSRGTVESTRSTLSQAGRFDRLNDLAVLNADLMRLEGQIRHAEQGYSGFSAAIRVNPSNLEKLYEYDYGFVAAADALARGLDGLPGAAMAPDGAALATIVATARGQVGQLDSAFRARMQAIEGIRVS